MRRIVASVRVQGLQNATKVTWRPFWYRQSSATASVTSTISSSAMPSSSLASFTNASFGGSPATATATGAGAGVPAIVFDIDGVLMRGPLVIGRARYYNHNHYYHKSDHCIACHHWSGFGFLGCW
jgi:hypothetical protein